MAGIQVAGGGRSVDGNVNMVPMIDLLVSMIAFLLMAAVWTHTGAVRSQQPKGPSDAPEVVTPALRVVVSPSGITVGRTAADQRAVGEGAGGLAGLRRALAEHRRADPSLRDVQIQPDTAVRYDQVIRVMDAVYDVWSEGAPRAAQRSDRVTVSLL